MVKSHRAADLLSRPPFPTPGVANRSFSTLVIACKEQDDLNPECTSVKDSADQDSAGVLSSPSATGVLSEIRENVSSIALAASGLLTFIGYFSGAPEYSHSVRAGLPWIAAAILLGLLAIATAARRTPPLSLVKQRLIPWLGLVALLILHSAIVLSLLHSTQVNIDTITFQQEAAQSLLNGVDPFGTTHPNVYTPDEAKMYYAPDLLINNRVQVGLQYPPLTLLCAVPGYLMGDIRLGFILAVMLSVVFLFATVPDGRGFAIAAILLFNPVTLVIEMKAWTEPLVLVTLSAVLFAAIRKPRYLAIAAGLFLASKQYNILALPLFGFLLPSFSWRAYGKLVLSSVAIAAATVLPFAIWNFHALWHDLVLFHLDQSMRADAVSFAVLFPIMRKIGPVIMLAFILWCARKVRPSAILFVAAYSMVLLLFFSTSKQAFLNYYFLIGNLFLITAVLLFQPKAQSAATPVFHAARA